jgi:peptidyl-prolyl cis-trans isomerase C
MLRWQKYAQARLTDAAVQQYYADNRDLFDRVLVRASHVVVRVPADAPPADVEAARKKLADLRAEVVAGKLDFAAAARAHSQCPSKDQGGDIGFFPRKWVVDESFARAAFALKPGEVSDVVRTDYGLHLIKVTERKEGEKSDFAKIKDEVRAVCADDLLQTLGAKLRKDAKVEIKLP